MLIFVARLLFMTAVWLLAEGKTSLPYRPENGDKKCNNMTSEYYLKALGICCSRCKPGSRLAVQCTSDSDTVCEPCQDGLYSSNFNHFPNCFKCPTCRDEKGLTYATKCSADTKSVCVCKPGMYCLNILYDDCQECKKYRSCKPGEGAIIQGSPTSDVKCAPCPAGEFSNRSNTEPCQPHTQCEGSSVLRLGNSTTDTVCEIIPSSTKKFLISPEPSVPLNVPGNIISQTQLMTSTTTSSPSPSSLSLVESSTSAARGSDLDVMIIMCSMGGVVLVLCLLMLVVTVIICKLRKRKAGLQNVLITDNNIKKEQDPSMRGTPDCQHLLPVDGNQKELSMTSSDSQSQPDSNQSHSSSDWLERNSQEECLPEQPSVSSPVVNLSITATFNCQLNPTAASCSIPLNPSPRTPHVETPVPLSQEEVCISCQQEDGKEALQSVQESGLCVY